MGYRSDDRARNDRRFALEQSLQRLDAELKDLEPLQQQRDAVQDELDAIRKDERIARQRELLPLLQRVTVATPCREKWDKMKGDERVRFCGRCDKNVYNLSAMSGQEANALLASQPNMCVRFFRRHDGTIVSGDCAGGIARRKWTGRLVGAGIAIGTALGAMTAHRTGSTEEMGARAVDDVSVVQGGMMIADEPEPIETVGEIAAPEPTEYLGGARMMDSDFNAGPVGNPSSHGDNPDD